MDIGTRVRVLSVSDVDGVGLDYGRMIGAEGTIIQDPIGEFRAGLGVDRILPHTVRLDDPTVDPMHEVIAREDPDNVGVIYLAEDEVEVITENNENTEDTVNA